MIPDALLVEERLKTFLELPWVLPAAVMMEITDEDLDHLDAAADTDKYWTVLNGIARRIEKEAA